ncbi:MAG: cell division ATP-binding protein FtsE [Candidatus Moraniibacteriota bacterium]|nr:MAG: cell division ATP-binding protein FtsE [Candidatus Moranbacteria bacterium]
MVEIPNEKHGEPLIVFDSVGKTYETSFCALQNLNFSIQEGEFVSLVGVSGAGKSTLLKLLYAEELPTEGEVRFGGRSTTAIKRRLLPYYRRNFGLVFQDFKLLPNRTIFENVAFPLEIDGWKSEEIRQEIPGILDIVNLSGKENAYPHQLSGGEKQRVCTARALVHRPRVLVADEPTGNLDPRAKESIISLLLKVNEIGTTVILATHASDVVDRIQRRVITLDKGMIIRDEKIGKYIY